MTPKYFTRSEIHFILKVAKKPRDHLLINLLWQTGARVSELIGIKLKDIDYYAKTITLVTLKRRKDIKRTIPLGPSILKETSSYAKKKRLALDDLLFPVTRDSVNKVIIKAVLNAGLDRGRAHPHTFRHSFAVHCLLQDNPLPLMVLKNILGHASISSTEIYAEITGAETRKYFNNINF